MTEMLGLASMAELPAVVVDCQRAGPATGMPSRTEQSDLDHAIFGGTATSRAPVLGVFDVVHAREAMHKAFHVAETWQLPVIVLSDAYIAQRRQIRDAVVSLAEPPRRQCGRPATAPRASSSGSSTASRRSACQAPRVAPHLAAGIEHTPEGFPTADTALHEQMNAKRFHKLDAVAQATADWYRVLGDTRAPLGIIAWGSQHGLLREWVRDHPAYTAFLPEILHPFPIAALRAWLAERQWACVLELSFQGQFHRYLGGMLDLAQVPSIKRSGGVPLGRLELERMLVEVKP